MQEWNCKKKIIIPLKWIYEIIYLIFIQLAAFKFFFTLTLKCDDNKTDKDVDHEKSDNNDIHNKINSHPWTIVEERPLVDVRGIDGVL